MIILDGNSYSFAIHFTGEVGELRYDSSNWDLLLHDGVTEGGRRFLNMTNADERYQARSTELDGLISFEPQQKGYLVRLGAADYRIRTITVDSANLVVTNGNAYNGNTLIGLKPTITSVHTWSGIQTFSAQIKADGGVLGNLIGNSTGTHTGNSVGNSAGVHTGSVDVRGANLLLDDGQIHLAALNDDVGEYILARGIPYGGIIMWSGLVSAIPEYWYLCDGGNGTPDLRDRFIVGAGNNYPRGATGGAAGVAPGFTTDSGGSHSHTGTAESHVLTEEEMPAHFHGGGPTDTNTGVSAWAAQGLMPASSSRSMRDHPDAGHAQAKTTTVGGSVGHTHTLGVDNGGAHTHTGTITTFDNRPPYYALAYIMKGV